MGFRLRSEILCGQPTPKTDAAAIGETLRLRPQYEQLDGPASGRRCS
jgi:hypothetical protein